MFKESVDICLTNGIIINICGERVMKNVRRNENTKIYERIRKYEILNDEKCRKPYATGTYTSVEIDCVFPAEDMSRQTRKQQQPTSDRCARQLLQKESDAFIQ